MRCLEVLLHGKLLGYGFSRIIPSSSTGYPPVVGLLSSETVSARTPEPCVRVLSSCCPPAVLVPRSRNPVSFSCHPGVILATFVSLVTLVSFYPVSLVMIAVAALWTLPSPLCPLVRALSTPCPSLPVLLVHVIGPFITALSEPCPAFSFSTALFRYIYVFVWLCCNSDTAFRL